MRKIQHYLSFLGASIDAPPDDGYSAEGVSFVGTAASEPDPVLDWTPPPEEVTPPEPPRRRGPPAVITRNAAGRAVFTNRGAQAGRQTGSP